MQPINREILVIGQNRIIGLPYFLFYIRLYF
uniref:Uncharacterized protein n=1 Tax=Siphoviridae sp. ctnPP24 TaxID=2825662 RepID=A0A8S5TZ50_9CAUD|nr:MAG TPA: hypothetical protein [Siphoviridae sp. ctnPP24]